MSGTVKFSIIIPTFRKTVSLVKTLQQLLLQSYPKTAYEVIVVSNDLNDVRTERVVRTLVKGWKNLRFIVEVQRSAAAARNAGVRVAKHRHLIFIDDDTFFSKDFLRGYSDVWQKYPRARMVGGGLSAKLVGAKKLNAAQKKLLQNCPWCFGQLSRGDKDEQLELSALLYSGNMSYQLRKNQTKVFNDSLGVFVPGIGRIGAEDFEVSTRTLLQKEKVFYSADPRVSVATEVTKDRFTENYVRQRHVMGGMEIALLENFMQRDFKNFQPFYLPFFKTWDGVKTLLFKKHERTMLLSYLVTKYFYLSRSTSSTSSS